MSPNDRTARAKFAYRLLTRNYVRCPEGFTATLRSISRGHYTSLLAAQLEKYNCEGYNEIVALAKRVITDESYGKPVVYRMCRMGVALAGNRGRSVKEVECQRRDLVECFV